MAPENAAVSTTISGRSDGFISLKALIDGGAIRLAVSADSEALYLSQRFWCSGCFDVASVSTRQKYTLWSSDGLEMNRPSHENEARNCDVLL
jgi:hypothetical protein|eukprot:COSAG06_NODE_2810_length_6246_cov_3.690743_4_plen_92_part_00